MMMMWDYYSNNDKRKWSIFQVLSVLVFTIIWIYALIFNWKLNYIISQLMFGFTWLKAFLKILSEWKNIGYLIIKLL